jgi:hypothetical protein
MKDHFNWQNKIGLFTNTRKSLAKEMWGGGKAR